MSDTAHVPALPECDLCHTLDKRITEAKYDAKTKFGPWAYLCESHYNSHGIGLGTGKGQKLIVR